MTDVVQFARPGDVDVLEVVTVPTPEPGPREVLVSMRAIGVNPVDCKQRAGVRPMPGPGPWRLGVDGAGVVAAVGTGAGIGFAVGDRVVVSGASGTYATDVVVPASALDRLPDSWSFEAGAGLGVPAGTAYQVLASLSLAPGETLLVHGGSGAVGQAAIQLAVAIGASVVATASPSRHERVAALGATPVAYGPGLLERVREVAPVVDVALDCAGTDEAISVSRALVDGSRIGTIVRGRDADALGIRAWLGGSPSPLLESETALRREAVPHVLAMPSYSVEIDSRHALDDVAAAHLRSDGGHPRGKIVLV